MKNRFDKQKADLKEKIKKTKSVNIHGGPTKSGDGGGLSEAEKKAFAPRQDTFTKGKTVTLSDGRQYSSPR